MRSLILSSLWLASQLVGSACAFGTTVFIAVDYCPATTSTTPIDSTTTSTSLSTPSVEPGEPFYLSFSLNIDLRRDLVRQYLTPNGSTTTNPEDAVAFIITPGGQLMSGRGYLSTSPGVTSQRFQVLSNLLPISTLFTTSETGALQWENSLFADEKASFCSGDGVFMVFDGNLPPGCLEISLDPIPATDIGISSSTTLSATFSSATSSRPSTAASSSTAATVSFSVTASTAPTTANPSATISSDTSIRTSTDPPSTTTPTYVSSTTDSTGTSPNPTASYPPGTVFGSLAYGVPNGCYISSIDSPAVFGPYTTIFTLAQCADFCADFKFFGVQAGSICACGPAVLGFLPGVCDVPCQGDPSTTCGGLSAAAVYEIVFRAGQQSSSSTNQPVSSTFLSTSVQSSPSSTTLFSTVESTSTTVASHSTPGHVTSTPSPSPSSSSLTSIEASTSSPQSPTLAPTSPGTSSQTNPPATSTVVGGTCSTIAPSAALCPNYDHQAINVNRDGYCYEVYCQEGLAGLELEEDSTYAASLKDCISFCTLYNVAIPFGCLGVDYEEASLGQNCRLLSDVSGTIPSVTRKAARLIYAGYPAVTDTSSNPSSLTTSSTSGDTVPNQSTSFNSETKTSSSGSTTASSTSNLGSQSSPSTPTTTNNSNSSSAASSVASVSITSRSTTFGSTTSATTGTANQPTTTSPGATSVASTITTATSLTSPGATTSTTTTRIVTTGTTTSTTTTTTRFTNVIAPVAPSRYPLSPLCENGFESRFQGGQLLRAVERSRYYDIECSIDYNEPPNARFPFDLTTTSYVECADACDFGALQLGGDERNCKAFSWVANTGECWLFNELTTHTLGSTVGIARRPGVHSGRYLYDEYDGLTGPQPGPNLQTYLRDPIPFP
ncbi:hypothetical protein, variant 1 [Exophiala mesophila]|nr:hypothetical protein, variant 1 [Exophiala mesophila]KIV96180.1 hypothetical protein, variant 1 [Exophiala mesophila]